MKKISLGDALFNIGNVVFMLLFSHFAPLNLELSIYFVLFRIYYQII